MIKAKCVKPTKTYFPNQNCNIVGIGEGTIASLGSTKSTINISEHMIDQIFHIVENDFPIPTDGIIGRDFFVNNRCTIDYDLWLLNISISNEVFTIPIEDNVDGKFIIPGRCEMVKRIDVPDNEEDELLVCSQEVQHGIFIGNSIINKKNPYVKFINTLNEHVVVKPFKPTLEQLSCYKIMNVSNSNIKHSNRIEELITKVKIGNISHKTQKNLYKLMMNYNDVFHISEDRLTANNFYEQSIELIDNTSVYIPNYKQIHSQQTEINSQVKKMLDDGIIEPSVSHFNSPILLVPKKSDSGKKWRLVIDFRQLNRKILPDKFPLPRIETILDQLGRARYFTTLDLMSGFHQIPLENNSKKYTAFSTSDGHYQYTRLPFGLNISPNSFQRMMTIAMAGLSPECAFIYVDDIVVIGCSENHHLRNLENVFERLRMYNLKLNPEKCDFFKSEVTYLGHKISDKGITPDDAKFSIIEKYPAPQNADEVRRFVAFCNYYRKFIQNFALIARPLNKLLRKDVKFLWTSECQESFENLKKKLLSPQILQFPDFSKDFTLTTDASSFACGAVLSQNHNGKDLPIAFASRTFTKGEENKAVIEKELAAIHWSINYFKSYLYGRKFKIRTDHRPLVYLFGMKNPTSKLTRIRLDLEEFDFTIEYMAGKENIVADALSRIKLNSDDLKSMFVLTRSMVKEQDNPNPNQTVTLQPDQLKMYDSLSNEEVRGIPKLEIEVIKRNKKFVQCVVYIMNKNYKKSLLLVGEYRICLQEPVALEYMVRDIEIAAENKSMHKIGLDVNTTFMKLLDVDILKKLASKILKKLNIVLFERPKIIIDSHKISEILEKNHNTPTGGHIGQNKLYKKLRKEYEWKQMKRTIAEFVRKCNACKMNKNQQKTCEKFVKTTTPLKPFEIISIDTVGPFVKTINNNRYAVTIQCDLSKYIVIIPTPNKEAHTIAKAIVEHFMLIYGTTIKAIRTDLGTEYKNELFTKINNFFEINHITSTAYHPQTIGSLERNHKCLNEYLRIFSNEHRNDWDEWTNYYCFSYNTTPNFSTNYTPFELVFGRSEKINKELLSTKINPIYNVDDYNQEFQHRLKIAYNRAKDYLEQTKLKTIQNQKNVKPIEIIVGDKVGLTVENRKKLDALYSGPYIVKNIIDPNVTIENMLTNQNQIVHKNRLIKI